MATTERREHERIEIRMSVRMWLDEQKNAKAIAFEGFAITRDISIGGQVHVDALLREFGSQGLEELGAKRILNGQYPAGMDTDRIASVLRDASGQLVLEVRKTMDFFRATSPVEGDALAGAEGENGCQSASPNVTAATAKSNASGTSGFRIRTRTARS